MVARCIGVYDEIARRPQTAAKRTEYQKILERNIVCADGLRYRYRFDGSPPYDSEYVPEGFEIPDQTVSAQPEEPKPTYQDAGQDLFG